jgi:hypothetical protein
VVQDGVEIERDAPVATIDSPVAGGAARSCMGLAATCGDGTKDCCASTLVPGTAVTFYRGNDVSAPATVSDLRLDVYEVTVGRFRALVNAGTGPGRTRHRLAMGPTRASSAVAGTPRSMAVSRRRHSG